MKITATRYGRVSRRDADLARTASKICLLKLRFLPETIAGAAADVDGEGFSPLGAAVAGLEDDGAAS